MNEEGELDEEEGGMNEITNWSKEDFYQINTNLDQGPTTRVKHKQVITIGQQNYLAFIQIKNTKIRHLN
jgi:hypothetical protein